MPTIAPFEDRFLNALIRIASEMHWAMSRDEVVAFFVDVIESLLPDDARLAIRLTDAEGDLDLVYATGRLRPAERARFAVSPSEVSADLPQDAPVEVTDTPVRLFEDAQAGCHFLLHDRTCFYGMLSVEFPAETDAINALRPQLAPVVHLLIASLRNSRLASETVRLTEYRERLLNDANAPVLVVDRDLSVQLVNRCFETVTGLSRDQVLGTSFWNLVDPGIGSLAKGQLERALSGVPQQGIEVRFTTEEETAHLVFNTAPIHDAYNHVESIIFVGQDLTAIRELQRQIVHTEKLATLGQIAAGVAHELNNPLTSISIYANYLRNKLQDVLDAGDLRRLDAIIEGAERIQTFTRDLVTYARPAEDTPTVLSLPRTVAKAVSFCEHLITAHDVEVVVDIPEDIGTIYGIQGQIEQVFVNLVTNACQAMPQGGTLTISAQAAENDYVCIFVRDTGTGIPQRHLRKVFEPFFTTKEVGKGTGLGLSIVKNIVKNHSGSIRVQSEEGIGTVFALTFKRAQ